MGQQQVSNLRHCTLLLTAAIKPPSNMQMTLANDNIREREYLDSVRFHSKALAACGLQRRMILVEGSESPAESLKDACIESGFEFIKYRYSTPDRERGKGHREATMIQYAIDTLGARDTLFLKITGRLRVLNLCAIINAIELQGAACFATAHAKTYYADTRVIAFTGAFWSHVVSLSNYIDDDNGRYLEHVVAAAIRVASLDGMRADYLYPPAQLLGTSGTHGTEYSESYLMAKLNSLKTQLKKKIFPLNPAQASKAANK